MTTEDPNIATLREALVPFFSGRQPVHEERARQALDALATTLAEKEARIKTLEIRRSESRQLLYRLTKYVKEDLATTPGTTRLARLTDQAADYLARTNEPNDVLRDDTAGVRGDG